MAISIHIPRVGDDLKPTTFHRSLCRFQSTSPVWGMTHDFVYLACRFPISIHIPRVGDDKDLNLGCMVTVVSIHIPRVGDDNQQFASHMDLCLFQSTSPVWGMTFEPATDRAIKIVSIHIPRVGDDRFTLARR